MNSSTAGTAGSEVAEGSVVGALLGEDLLVAGVAPRIEGCGVARAEVGVLVDGLAAGRLMALESRPEAAFFGVTDEMGLLGGVVDGVLSTVLDEDACVGRIIRARKLSSTCFSFFVGG